MTSGLVLTPARLRSVRDALAAQVCRGLEREPVEAPGVVRCLPTWQYVPETRLVGQAVVLDTGGTWVRGWVVDAVAGVVRSVPAWAIPRPGPIAVDDFVDRHADIVRRLDPAATLPVGWIWSFPARAQPDGDALHLAWTKAFPVVGDPGSLAGALRRRIGQRRVAVLNDTVAALLAGCALRPDVSGWLGLIVGTGHNIAVAVAESGIPRVHRASARRQVVNLESGGFDPGPLTPADAVVDAEERPGWQRIEKAVSGYTMARLYTLLGGSGQPDHAGDVVSLALLGDPVADALVSRSASLVAAAVAGAATVVARPAAVSGEGSLFGNPAWRARFQEALGALDPGVEVLAPIADANSIGAAVAALGLG